MTGYFIFDDIDTRTYSGIYVTFDDIDKTPKRLYEEIDIPARNGKFYLDTKRYEDVEHVYHIIATTKANGSALINSLASKVGYCKLQDSFNTDEYYEAVFSSGAEVDITPERDTNKFKITFTRKPQRFLTSGETKTSVANNGTISNPTLFDSRPIIEFQGYGNIGINGQNIKVESIPIGTVVMSNGTVGTYQYKTSEDTTYDTLFERARIEINSGILNNGDKIYISDVSVVYDYSIIDLETHCGGIRIQDQTGNGANTVGVVRDEKNQSVIVTFDPVTFEKGTASNISHVHMQFVKFDDAYGSIEASGRNTTQISYDGANTIILSSSNETSDPFDNGDYIATNISTIGVVRAASSMQISGVITINLDLGEAYWISNNVVNDANYAVSLGTKLPTLKSGSNTITYDNTITNFKITPNWWKV